MNLFIIFWIYWSLFNHIIILNSIKLGRLSSFFVYNSLLILFLLFFHFRVNLGIISTVIRLVGIDQPDYFFMLELIQSQFFLFLFQNQFFSLKFCSQLFSLSLKSTNLLIPLFLYLRPLTLQLLDLFLQLVNRVFVDLLLLSSSFFLFLLKFRFNLFYFRLLYNVRLMEFSNLFLLIVYRLNLLFCFLCKLF